MRYIVLIFLLFLGIPQKKHDISLKLKSGQTYFMTIRVESDFLMNVNNMEMLIGTTHESRLSFLVAEAIEDQYKLIVQYERISMLNEAPFATMKFSSDSPDSTNMMTHMLAGMVRKPFYVYMDMKGNISEITGFDTVFSHIRNMLPEDFDDQGGEIGGKMKEVMGDVLLTGNMDLLSSIYPAQPLAIKEAWTDTVYVSGNLAGSAICNFELSDIKKRKPVIKGEMESYLKDENATLEVMGKRMQYDLDGNMSYNCILDKRSGWIEEAIITQNFKGEIKMMADDPWNERAVPVTITSKITFVNK
jgi:hypothetical protein